MAKKTISVQALKDTINSCLKDSTCDVKVRDGMIFTLEHVLFETGNYAGYRYLLQSEVPDGAQPGVNYETNEAGMQVPCSDYTTRFANTDGSRRHYF